MDPATLGGVYRFDWVAGRRRGRSRGCAATALVEEQFAKTHDLAVGDRVPDRTPSGGSARLTAVGEYRDPQLLQGMIVAGGPSTRLSAAATRSHLVEGRRRRARRAGARRGARSRRSRPPRSSRSDEYRDFLVGQLDQLVYLLYALLAMSLVISLFGIANSLFLSIHERTREFGLLRAIGATPAQVRRIVRYESVITAVIGGLLGTASACCSRCLVTPRSTTSGSASRCRCGQLASS